MLGIADWCEKQIIGSDRAGVMMLLWGAMGDFFLVKGSRDQADWF